MLNQEDFKETNYDNLKKKHRLYSNTDFNNFCMNEYLEYMDFIQTQPTLSKLRNMYNANQIDVTIMNLSSVKEHIEDEEALKRISQALELLHQVNQLAYNETKTIGN